MTLDVLTGTSFRFYCPFLDIETSLGSSLVQRLFEKVYADIDSANRLFSLRPLALASLTSLTIALNECKIYETEAPQYEIQFYECFDCTGWEEVEGDEASETASVEWTTFAEPLGSVSRNDKDIILEWNRLCKHIARCIPPHRLRLSLICDVEDAETAQEVIEPMRQLPLLSACSIRLSTGPDHNLRRMAIKATHELTGRSSPPPPSPRLPQLPHEIQIQILQHTDLVAPHDLRWVPGQGFICLSRSPSDKDRIWAQGPFTLNSCEMCFGVHKPRHRLERQHLKIACASQCSCWRFPSELFLVSSAYHREATRTFYSSNHFYIYGDIEHSTYERDKCPQFIQQLPQDARQYLRSLQFLLPATAKWSQNDWKQDILLLKGSVELSRLTITIDQSLWRDRSTELQNESVWERILGIVEPFRRLTGLKDFFVHLDHPKNRQNNKKLRSKWEKILERRVMGRSYDSEERGKYLHRHRVYDL